MSEQLIERVELRFLGRPLAWLGWYLFMMVANVLVIPSAWGAAAYYRWFFGNVSPSDGSTVSWYGRAEKVWYWFSILGILYWVMNLVSRMGDSADSWQPLTWLCLVFILAELVSLAIWLVIARWVFASTKVSSGSDLAFRGTYLPLLGWSVLLVISVLTIIGWAWVTVGMVKWFYRNVEFGQNRLVFEGRGAQVLWRYIVACLACVFIIPIPWITIWLIRWFVEQTVVERPAQEASGETSNE